ncbi:MAG: sigma-70 family RNA polymerase sigma factor [Verrucomicrobiota bacterium]
MSYLVDTMAPQATNREWCERLYDERAAGLLLYGQALGLDRAAAEDVVHEAFEALLRLPVPPAAPAHYLVRAFRNRALNHWRSLWRRRAREREAEQWFEPVPDDSARAQAALSALGRLEPGQREVIVLKIWNGLTFDQIAEMLALSPNTVAGRYRYGLQRLRAGLEGETYDEPERTGAGTAGVDTASAVTRRAGAAVPRAA